MGQIRFGTDGWRAVIAEDFTFKSLERVAQATADYWNANHVEGTQKRAVVGYDRRFLSDQFAARTAEVLAGNGFQVTLTSVPTPTPAVSLAVKAQRAIGGVMITASHNPPVFNGFKLKAHYGGSAEPVICQGVEARQDQSPIRAVPLDDALKQEQVVIKNIRPAHCAAVKRLVIKQSWDRCCCAPKIGAHVAGLVFRKEPPLSLPFTQRVDIRRPIFLSMHAHDPFFGGINPEPIPKNYGASAAFLKKHPHDICLVTDGDADRVGGMDGRGNPLSTHQLICLLLHHFIVNRKGRGRVVKALTTTSMVDKMCVAQGLELIETAVGFKYVASEMLKGGVLLGFEESGGIGFPGHIPERDGILAGLMLLELLATERKSVNKLIGGLEKQFGPHRYARIDAHFPLEKRAALMEFCKTNPPAKLLRSAVVDVKSFDGVKFIAADGSWLMLRGSGTEPILRIYAEAASNQVAESLLKLGIRLTRQV